MKKICLLFKIFTIIVGIICAFILSKTIIQRFNRAVYNEFPELIVYDKPADWLTVKQESLRPQKIDRELQGHFLDAETNGCFFLVMKMFDIDVDIDDYYWTYFNEYDEEIIHLGKVSPDKLYDNSLLYISTNCIELSTKNISNKSIDYILDIGRNNYPIIIWYGSTDWTAATPYIIYAVDNDMVYMYNLDTTIGVKIDRFKEKYSGYAIVYGKYW